MDLFLVDFRSVHLNGDIRLGVMNFSNGLVVCLNVLLGGLFVCNIHGRIIVFVHWFSMMNLRSLFLFFDVDRLFMVNFIVVMLGRLLVVGLGNVSRF